MREEIERGLTFGLEAAPTINDRRISTFVRGELPHFAGERGTFLKCPFIEDVNKVDDAEVAIFGVPLDAGATYRPGTRFGPQGIRRSTNLFGTYNYESGVDLREQLNMVDIGDVFTIPGNLEKSFDQISQAMAHVVSKGVMPIVLGGDHSIGFPDHPRDGPVLDGNVGIIHFDRHVDTQEIRPRRADAHHTVVPRHQHQERPRDQPGADRHRRLAERPGQGVKVGRERKSTVITVGDVERVGVEKIAEMALEIAWKDAKAVYLSFDIDVIDAGFVPGTGWPEPGGLLPREALNLVKMVSEPGLAGIEVVECSPPYDWAEQTALLSSRVILDSLAAQVRSGKLGNKAAATGPSRLGAVTAALAWSHANRVGADPERHRTRGQSEAGRGLHAPRSRRRREPGAVPRGDDVPIRGAAGPRSPSRWTGRGPTGCAASRRARASPSSPGCSCPPTTAASPTR